MATKNKAGSGTQGQMDFDFTSLDEEQQTLQSSKPPTAWRAPMAEAPKHDGASALAHACAIGMPALARSLLALPVEWDYNARFNLEAPLDQAAASKSKTALAHLLSDLRIGYAWGRAPSFHEDLTPAALTLVERGADLLAQDFNRECPISLAASAGLEGFIASLKGHPDYTFEKLQGVKVGSLPDSKEYDHDTGEWTPKEPESDSRLGLLAYATAHAQLKTMEGLVRDAGFPVNEKGLDGRYPISYCRTLESLEKLLELGADPALQDGEGLNAFAHVQSVQDTATREKMIKRIAESMRRGKKASSDELAELQKSNMAALIEAAEQSTKSSLLATIRSFKFDVSKAFDPSTGMTPAMAAFRGGKIANAMHLLNEGCDVNAKNAEGLSCAAFMLSATPSSNGPGLDDVAKAHAKKIDFLATDKRGWPVLLQAFHLKGRKSHGYSYYGYRSKSNGIAESLASQKLGKEAFQAADGTSFLEAFALGLSDNSFDEGNRNLYGIYNKLSQHFDRQLEMMPNDGLDRAMKACLIVSKYVGENECFDNKHVYSRNELCQCVEELSGKMEAGQRMPETMAYLEANAKLRASFSKAFPELLAKMEASEISQAADAAAPKAAKPGVRL